MGFISDLDPASPPFDGPAGLGDDEIRQLKQDLQDQFAGEAGDLYDIAVTVGPRSLNAVNDKANQADLDALDARVSTLETNDAVQDAAILDFESRISTIEGDYTTADQARDLAWPVGSLFVSADGANPSTKGIPGTWAAIGAGRVLLSASSGFGSEAGDSNKKITKAQLPQHKHEYVTHRQQAGDGQGTIPTYASTDPGRSFNSIRGGTNSPDERFVLLNTNEGIGLTDPPADFNVTPAHFTVAFYQRTA